MLHPVQMSGFDDRLFISLSGSPSGLNECNCCFWTLHCSYCCRLSPPPNARILIVDEKKKKRQKQSLHEHFFQIIVIFGGGTIILQLKSVLWIKEMCLI